MYSLLRFFSLKQTLGAKTTKGAKPLKIKNKIDYKTLLYRNAKQ